MLSQDVIQELVKTALEARKKAYAPYSAFRVGAAVLANDGRIYSGCNIENASYGATVCAERTAVFKAVSEGKRKLCGIAIAGGHEEEPENFVPPCGICRQVISEFAEAYEEFVIILAKTAEEYKVLQLKDLFPDAFSL